MKNLTLLILTSLCAQLNAQTITEIMYNPPESGVDSLEYIEIYNNTNDDIDLVGYSMVGVSYTFENTTTLSPDEYLVVCKDRMALLNNFGANGYEWDSGALSNTGEELGLINSLGDTILSVNYLGQSPWPTIANGEGASIELCDLNSEISIDSNWEASQGQTGIIINAIELFGTPGQGNSCAITSTISLSENGVGNSAIVYPNPTSGEINISSTQTIMSIEIYNSLGQLVTMEEGQSLSSFHLVIPGRYYAKVIYKEGFDLLPIVRI